MQLVTIEWAAWHTVPTHLCRGLDAFRRLTDAQPRSCRRLPRFEENSFAAALDGSGHAMWSVVNGGTDRQ